MIDPSDIPAPLLIDGGLATELEAKGFNLAHTLWSARLLQETPQAIVDAHLAYLRAGAGCIISASYQASIPGFQSQGLTHEQAQSLLQLSVTLGKQAIAQFCKESMSPVTPLLAASIGPYGAFLADGSEYRGDYTLSEQELVDFHRQRLALLVQANPDFLACETIPCLVEANALSQLIEQYQAPAWISFSCRNGQQLSSGEAISDAAKRLKDNPYIFAIGINCSAPQYISELLTEIKRHWRGRIVVYPNSGEHYQADSGSWTGTTEPQDCGLAAGRWLQQGANIIGGCCRMGPEHIQAMQQQLSVTDSSGA
ncbi:MAG: homocysteine S-methyltransferase [Halioglobus sp.]